MSATRSNIAAAECLTRRRVENFGISVARPRSRRPPPFPPLQAGEGKSIYPPPLAGEGREGGRYSPGRPVVARNPPPHGGTSASTATPTPSGSLSHRRWSRRPQIRLASQNARPHDAWG